MAFERRMQHARDLGPLLQPARDLQARPGGGGRAARPWCAARACRDRCRRGRRRARASMHGVARAAARSPGIGRHAAEHHVGMAADIFGAGLDRQVDALLEGAEIERGRPGIVHQHHRAAWRGRQPRSPARPASRTTASPAPRRTPRAYSAASARRCRRRSADRNRSWRRRSGSSTPSQNLRVG